MSADNFRGMVVREAHVVFPDCHNFVLRHPCSPSTFNVGDWHITHDFSRDFADGTIPAQKSENQSQPSSVEMDRYVLLDQDTISKHHRRTPHPCHERWYILDRKHWHQTQQFRRARKTLHDTR